MPPPSTTVTVYWSPSAGAVPRPSGQKTWSQSAPASVAMSRAFAPAPAPPSGCPSIAKPTPVFGDGGALIDANDPVTHVSLRHTAIEERARSANVKVSGKSVLIVAVAPHAEGSVQA